MESVFKLVDKTYKNLNLERSFSSDQYNLNYEFDDSISRYKYGFSFKNKYGILKLSDFYFYHSQQLLFVEKDEKRSDVFFFFYVMISSFDIDQHLDRNKYNLIKNVFFSYVNIEDVYRKILRLHPVNESDQNLFSLKRIEKRLLILYKNEEVDFKSIVIHYLDSLRNTENNELLSYVKEFSIDFLKKIFSDKPKSVELSRQVDLSIDSYKAKRTLRLLCENKIDIRSLYLFEHDSYVRILEKALKNVLHSNIIANMANFKNHKKTKDLKLKFYSEYFIETSSLLFFKSKEEIVKTKNKIVNEDNGKLFDIWVS